MRRIKAALGIILTQVTLAFILPLPMVPSTRAHSESTNPFDCLGNSRSLTGEGTVPVRLGTLKINAVLLSATTVGSRSSQAVSEVRTREEREMKPAKPRWGGGHHPPPSKKEERRCGRRRAHWLFLSCLQIKNVLQVVIAISQRLRAPGPRKLQPARPAKRQAASLGSPEAWNGGAERSSVHFGTPQTTSGLSSILPVGSHGGSKFRWMTSLLQTLIKRHL